MVAISEQRNRVTRNFWDTEGLMSSVLVGTLVAGVLTRRLLQHE